MNDDNDQMEEESDVASDGILWEDVSKAAQRIFSVWYSGSELEWAEECWGHFREAGLASYEGPLETTSAYLRLVTLGRIYQEFCGLMWDENSETPITYLAEDLKINPLALGILAGQAPDSEFEGLEDEFELQEQALEAASRTLRAGIYECLTAAYGSDIKLYSRMSQTNRSDDDDSDGEEFEVTGSNSVALSYVMNRFQHG